MIIKKQVNWTFFKFFGNSFAVFTYSADENMLSQAISSKHGVFWGVM